jgi:uncharacterized membrane protein
MGSKVKWFLFSGVLFLFASCYYDKEEVLYPGGSSCSSVVKKFSTDVNPLVQTKCAISSECHSAGSTNSGGALTSYDQIRDKSVNIRHQVVTHLMPKTGSITNEELKSIICWIDSGSPLN